MADEELTSFHGRLEYLARKNGVNVTELGVLAGLSTDTVSKWIRQSKESGGTVSGNASAHKKLAERWEVTLDWLHGAVGESDESGSSRRRYTELDTERDRQWIRASLIEAGFERGVAAEVAMTIEFKGARSPEQVIEGAKEVARLLAAESRGKLVVVAQSPAAAPSVGGNAVKRKPVIRNKGKFANTGEEIGKSRKDGRRRSKLADK